MSQKLVVKDVLITDIITDGQQIRYSIDDDRIVELAMSITSKGLLEPIVVEPCADGRFQLLAGSRRLMAYKRLKRTHIPAVIRPADGSPIKTIALIENVMQEPMTLAEEVEAVCHLHDVEKQSPGQICDTTGKGRAWVDRRLAIPYLHKEVQAELLDGRITLRHAEIINAVEAENLRALLLNNVMQQKLTAHQTEELAKIYQNAPSMEDAIKAGIETASQIQGPQTPTRKCDHCGVIRPLDKIILLAVCREGCVQLQLDAKGKNNGDHTG